MVHAPEITDYVKTAATKLDVVSDEVDAVNILKGNKEVDFAAESQFDAEKDKTGFRQYEEACDRVKNFYAVSIHARHKRTLAHLCGQKELECGRVVWWRRINSGVLPGPQQPHDPHIPPVLHVDDLEDSGLTPLAGAAQEADPRVQHSHP